jgi:alpha-L-arabinofuranosidase
LMERAGHNMNGLSLHNYTLVGGTWPPSGSAIKFGEDQWFSILKHALAMDDLIAKHSEVMDKHDPEKKVGMIVDEWGTWFAQEPGSTPGFLYQQNSLCDALVAAVHFHIFHRHADRVTMANIAQMVNVLQAMILTDGPKMLRTPTYWVFEMFKVHQNAQVIPLDIDPPEYTLGSEKLPALSVSATKRAHGGTIDISLANLDPNQPHTATIALGRLAAGQGDARILTAPTMQAHNTFDAPDQLTPAPFTAWKLVDGSLKVDLPSKSVVMISLKQP